MSSRSSYNNPKFKPFQSGSTLCYPSKDYANFTGGNSLISDKPGKNLYKDVNYKVDKATLEKLTLGKSYSTSAGGAKKSKCPNKKGGSSLFESQPSPIKKSLMKDMKVHTDSEMSGGKKKYNKRSTKKGGVSPFESQPSPIKKSLMKDMKVHTDSEMSGGKKKNNRCPNKKGGMTEEESPMSGGKRRVGRPRKLKGGQETEGATGMPLQFYNGKSVESYPANNGKGVETPYGTIDPKDAGVGNLAPYNTSKNASKLSMMKTGGKKKQTKNYKGGLRTIPSLSDRAFRVVDKVVNNGAKDIKTFFKDLQKNYEKSLVKIQQTKNGMSRLQGGVKKRRNLKKTLKGGDGSDFAATLNSRGPVNAPDKGEKMFRVFNKTGQYIPNSELPKAAAPQLTSGPKVTKVSGYTTFESTSAPITGGKKQVSKKKPVKKPVKKTTPKKKPVKKTAPKKKK